MDYWAALVYPSNFSQTAEKFDDLVWSYLEVATGLTLPRTNNGGGYECVLDLPIESLSGRTIQHHIARLPISKSGLGLRSVAETAGPAFIGGVEMSLPSFIGDLGLCPELEEVIGRPDIGSVDRWGTLLSGGTRTCQEFADAWGKLHQDATERCD